MFRYYLMTPALDSLKEIEDSLEANGIGRARFRTISHDDAGLESMNLNAIEDIMKKDIIRMAFNGAMVGVLLAAAVAAIVYFTGLVTSTFGWTLLIYASILILGFCTWEGGFIGLQRQNPTLQRFRDLLSNGYHLLLVDVESGERRTLSRLVTRHGLKTVAIEKPPVEWLQKARYRLADMLD